MKRYIPIALLLLAALGCKKEEDSFKLVGDPYFKITVRDDGALPLAELDDMSAQYTLNLESDGYSANVNANNHIKKAPRFHVESNLRWKIVPADEEAADWIIPFPEVGEKEGIFFFKMARHIDPDNGREKIFNILVDDGTNNWEPLEGLLKVAQAKSPHFLETNVAVFNVESGAKNITLKVSANVPWTYSLAPQADYATADLEWITDNSEHTAEKQVDDLSFRVAANAGGIRGATLTINYNLDGEDKADVIPITQYPATEADIEGFPVKWAVRVADNTFASTFPVDGTISPVSGSGLITFNNECGKAADKNGKVMLDLNDNSPRATGVWPGDYCEFAAHSPVSAGTIAKLCFATRVSGTGHKYWRLEYRDGETWKIAGKANTDEAVLGPDGKPVVYTHAMAADGTTNIKVESIVIYAENTDQAEFRFICAANYKADGSGPLSAPNGGTWRLSVDSTDNPDDAYQPSISIVAAGSETLVKANLSVAPSYLTFEGKSAASKKFTVTCDQDFTITPEQSWIHVDQATSGSGENIPFTVTCDDNDKDKLREGKITVKAGITRAEVAIIQSAGAGSGGGGGEGGGGETPPEGETTFPVKWSFPNPSTLTAETDYHLQPGCYGTPETYLYSDNHSGKLTLKTSATSANANSPTFMVRGSSDVYAGRVQLLTYCMGPNSNWEIKLYNVNKPAGRYTASFSLTASSAGPRYFILEYSTDGTTWTADSNPAGMCKATPSSETADVPYSFQLAGNNIEVHGELGLDIPAVSGTLYLRARVCSAMRNNLSADALAANSGGTFRIFCPNTGEKQYGYVDFTPSNQ